MSDYYLSRDLENGERMFIAPIDAEMAAANNIELAESVGYYLYKRQPNRHRSDVEILAKLPSEEAVFKLGKILGLA
jgi:hypothetical protein